VHEYLELGTDQVVYHFAIGYPIPDPRLSAGSGSDGSHMIGLLVHGDNHFITRGPLPDRQTAPALVQQGSFIRIGATAPPHLERWSISIQALRKGLEWGQIAQSRLPWCDCWLNSRHEESPFSMPTSTPGSSLWQATYLYE
jgi:hypothetical protein